MTPYFFTDNHNKPQGPVDINELIHHGVNQSTLVWRQGMDDWQRAGSLAELAGLFPPPVPRTSPPPIPPDLAQPIRNQPPTTKIPVPSNPIEKNPPAFAAQPAMVLQGTDDDTIVYSGKANHFLNGESVGGNLYLFRHKIQFKSHSLNIQTHVLDIELSQIKEVTFYNTLGLVPNGLALNLNEGKTEKFVVYKRNFWKAEIENLLKNSNK